MPVVRLARMGGQYAKPRSKQTEIVDGKEIPSFRFVRFRIVFPLFSESDSHTRARACRGDNVNGISPSDRLPDPERLLSSYFHSASTVNHVRSLLASGFASLPHKSQEDVPWSLPLSHVRSPELLASYENIVEQLGQALEFMSVIGASQTGGQGVKGALESAEIFMSHEVREVPYTDAPTTKFSFLFCFNDSGISPSRTGSHARIRIGVDEEMCRPCIRTSRPRLSRNRLLLHLCVR